MTIQAWDGTKHYHPGEQVTQAGETYTAQRPTVGTQPPDWPWEKVTKGVPLARLSRRVADSAGAHPYNYNDLQTIDWDELLGEIGDVTYDPVTHRVALGSEGVWAVTINLAANADVGDVVRIGGGFGFIPPAGHEDDNYVSPQMNSPVAAAGAILAQPLVWIDWFPEGWVFQTWISLIGTDPTAHFTIQGSTLAVVRLT